MANLSNINDFFAIEQTTGNATFAGKVAIGTLGRFDTLLNLEGAVNTSIITLGCTKNDSSWSGERIGGINFYSADGSGPGASVRGSINYIATSSSGGSTAMNFATGDNSTAMTIDNDGKVGIGTTSPDADLQIITTGSSDQDGVLKIGGSAASLGLVIDYDQSSSTVAKITSNPTYTSTTALMKLCVDGDANPDQLVLTGAGNVGIGITAPGAILDIARNATKTNTGTSEIMYIGTSNEASNYATLQVYTEGAAAAADRKWMFQTIEQGVANAGNIILQPSGGNVGIGATPGTFLSTIKVLRIGQAASFSAFTNSLNTYVSSNVRVDATGTNKAIVTGESAQYRQSDGTHIWYNAASVSADATSTLIERMRIASTGATTITSSAPLALTINPISGSYGGILFQYDSVTKGSSIYNANTMVYGGESGIATRLQAGGAYCFHADATNQNVHLGGTTNVSSKLQVTGDILATSDITAYSDKKLKKNIKTLDGSKVYEMRGVSFDRIDTGKASSGVIAQEIQKIAPELIKDNGGTLGIAYGNLTGYLIEAIKELKTEIEELKNKPCVCNNCNCNK